MWICAPTFDSRLLDCVDWFPYYYWLLRQSMAKCHISVAVHGKTSYLEIRLSAMQLPRKHGDTTHRIFFKVYFHCQRVLHTFLQRSSLPNQPIHAANSVFANSGDTTFCHGTADMPSYNLGFCGQISVSLEA